MKNLKKVVLRVVWSLVFLFFFFSSLDAKAAEIVVQGEITEASWRKAGADYNEVIVRGGVTKICDGAFANAFSSCPADRVIYCFADSTAKIFAEKNNYQYQMIRVRDIFSDVKEEDWYVDAIQYVYDNELMSGSNGTFRPTNNITRGQLVTTLYRLAGEPEVTDFSALEDFSDVAEGEYYTDAVCWAYSNGVATGSEGYFMPTYDLTRQQMVTFFFRFADVMGYDISAIEDYSSMLNADKVGFYARPAMQWAVGTGLISGSVTIDENGEKIYDLKPYSETTRAQVATILQRFCEEIRDKQDGVWSYRKNSDGTITINGYREEVGEKIIVPSEIDGMLVTALSGYTFDQCEQLEEIIIPDTVERIGTGCFAYCYNLKNVILPENLKEIGDYAFEANSNLETIVIPEGVSEIPDFAFYECGRLKNVVFSKNLQSIGKEAFMFCESLVTIEIPEKVVSIGEYAFAGSGNHLSRIIFLGDAPQIDQDTFGGIECSAYYFAEKEGWDEAVGKQYEGEVTWISLNELPEMNQQEWLYAENEDGTIRLVKYLGDELVTNFEVPAEVDGKKVTVIGAGLFANMESLTEVTIPDQIRAIENGAFAECGNLKKVSLSVNVRSIEKLCFFGCGSLKEIEIPEGVTVIKEAAFEECIGLEKINFPGALKTIEKDAFSECNGLKNVILPEGLTEIGNGAFLLCENLERIVIPNTLTKIDKYAISYCYNLKEVVLEEGLTVLGNAMFYMCESLEKVTIPSTIKVIPEDIFYECISLENIVIPESVEEIGERAFAKCYNLEEVVISKSVKKIERGAFMICTNLQKITFEGSAPEVVFDIEEPVFSQVKAEVYYPANDTTWNEGTFEEFCNRNLTWIPYEATK